MATVNEPQAAMPRNRLVYTSAGPEQMIDRWLRGRRTFDVWVTAHDPSARVIAPRVDRFVERAGSKWQNLHALYASEPDALDAYDHVLLLDDDVRITGRGLERLFYLHEEHGLAVSQPSFLPAGKISWPVTRCRPTCLLRHTDFVEVNAPLVRRDLLVAFLGEYGGRLVGYGIDHWLLHHIGPGHERQIAVIDDVPCVNPTDAAKGGRGSLDSLQSRAARADEWARFSAAYRIPERRGITIKRIPNTPGRAALNTARYAGSRLQRLFQWRR